MNTIKKNILNTIYSKYATWTADEKYACQKGCSQCCTQNVLITAIEADDILAYVRKEKTAEWFAHCLTSPRKAKRVTCTTNGFARMCLEKKEGHPPSAGNASEAGICPFLSEGSCAIYAVRPFACRAFASQQKCQTAGHAELPERLLVLTTVTMQLIEHLGQLQYWGNMLDVLTAMTDLPENSSIENYIDDTALITASRARLLKAEPLPGFLLMPGEEKMVEGYLQTIFREKIGAKSVEQILNNR